MNRTETAKLNDLRYWYPKVKDIVKTPDTVIVEADGIEFIHMLDGNPVKGWDSFLHRMWEAVRQIGGTPCFLRTGHTSGKHQWKDTCYLTDMDCLPEHIYNLVEFSFIADFWGLPLDTWAVRKLLPTEPVFTAFYGDMPITRELRLFVKDGKIVHWQPYWPAAAIKGHCKDPVWLERMPSIQSFSESELWDLSIQTIAINKAVPGYWSVDWLHTKTGWYMIDMAIGDMSYKWDFKHDSSNAENL